MASGEVEQANFAGRLHPSQRKIVLKSLPIEYGAIVVGIVWMVLAEPAAQERIAHHGYGVPGEALVSLLLGFLVLLTGLWAVLPRVLEVLFGRVRMMHGRLDSADMYKEPNRQGLFTRVSYNVQSRFRANIGVWSLPVDPRIPNTAHAGQEVTVFYTPIRGRVVGISPAVVPGSAGEFVAPEKGEVAQANFAGRLHPSQRKYIRRGYAWPLVWLVFGAFYLYGGIVSKDRAPFLAAAALLLFVFLRMTYRKVREIRAGKVEPIKGNPRVRVDEANFSGLAVLGPGASRVRKALSTRYTIFVDGREFTVSHRIRLHPARHNTVFITPRLRRVVNIAPSP